MTNWSDAVSDLQSACQDTFGIPVSYIPSIEKRPCLAGAAIKITGIFDESRETVNLMAGGGGGGMEAVIPRPVVELRLTDLGIDPLEGDEVVVDGVTYRIMDVQRDGHGSAALLLNRDRDLFA